MVLLQKSALSHFEGVNLRNVFDEIKRRAMRLHLSDQIPFRFESVPNPRLTVVVSECVPHSSVLPP